MSNKKTQVRKNKDIYLDKCPVCGNSVADKGIQCSFCGYDLSLDYKSFPTLDRIDSQAEPLGKLKLKYDEKLENERKRQAKIQDYDNAVKRIIELEEENRKLKLEKDRSEETENTDLKEADESPAILAEKIKRLEEENSEHVASIILLESENKRLQALFNSTDEENAKNKEESSIHKREYLEKNSEYKTLSQKFEALEKENAELKKRNDTLKNENVELDIKNHPYKAMISMLDFWDVFILIIEWLCFLVAVVSVLNTPAIGLVNIPEIKLIFLAAMVVFGFFEWISFKKCYNGILMGNFDFNEGICVISFIGFIGFLIYSVICFSVSVFKYGIKDLSLLSITVLDIPLFECFFICVFIIGIIGILKDKQYNFNIIYGSLFKTFIVVTLIGVICVAYFKNGFINIFNISDNTTIEYSNGDIYNGDVVDGKRQGYGIMTYANGDIYEGNWTSDLKSGYGEMNCEGWIYKGDWENDHENGYGICCYKNEHEGYVYDGEWKDGEKSGRGKMTYPDGDEYDGEWEYDKKNGYGILKYSDGTEYNGEWKDGEENGHGIFKYQDGTEYDGKWVSNKMNGHGIMKYADGTEYDGMYKDNNRYGKGIYRWKNGDEYYGMWKDDKMNGHGIMIYATGDIKEGEWKDDELIKQE